MKKLFRYIKRLFKKKKPVNIVRPLYHSSNRVISKEGLELIKEFEGYASKSYLCSGNVWTIGYGTTVYIDGTRVREGDYIDQKHARDCLANDIKHFSNKVDNFLYNKKIALNDNQFSALVSFCYNLGLDPLVNSKRSMHKAIVKNHQVREAFMMYCFAAGKKLNGLVRRRKAEADLYFKELKGKE